MSKNDYWQRRMRAVEEEGYKLGYDSYKETEKALLIAERELNTQIEVWINRIADNEGVSYAQARKLLKGAELEEFKWDVNTYIDRGMENAVDGAWMKELENASARAHITRLEAFSMQIRAILEEAYGKYYRSTKSALTAIYETEYYHTAFEVQKGIGVAGTFNSIDKNAIEKVINTPWSVDGKEFSARIWEDRTRMIGTLRQEITRQIATGDSPDEAIKALTKEVKKDIKNARQKAGTLVMTESAAIGNRAQHDCYKELGVEEYIIIETLDSHTCEYCGQMDYKHYPMTQFQIGSTAPPFHPNCRGCTAPYFDDEFQPKKRAARDPETGETVYVDDMSYEEWKKAYVDTTPENVIIKAAKDNGLTGEVSIKPKQIDLKNYTFDDAHINKQREHGVTREEAERFMRDALISITRWNGQFVNYYGKNGAVFIDVDKKVIRTAFKAREYDSKIEKFMEVVKKYDKH